MKVFAVGEQYISNVRQDQENYVFLKIHLSALKMNNGITWTTLLNTILSQLYVPPVPRTLPGSNLKVFFSVLLSVFKVNICQQIYVGADKSLARPISRRIFFSGESISFDASLAIYINSNNIPPIVIINRKYKTQNLLSP